ncbi:MAG TPA: acylphosphatase [Dissulfurispiraceae bacterium]|nr:acylphosphatase [Dissulfurispiraceae bacterium]
MITRAHLLIDGRVQGVAYRYFTQNVAARLGLAGWVKNLPDRRVEAVFEGERDMVEQAIQKCSEGPSFARVTNVQVTWEDRLEGLRAFEIRR